MREKRLELGEFTQPKGRNQNDSKKAFILTISEVFV